MSSYKLVSTSSSFLVAALFVVASPQSFAKDNEDHGAKKMNPRFWEKVVPARSDRDKERDVFEDFSKDFSLFYACQNTDTEWYLRRTLEHIKTNVALDPNVRKISTKSSSIKKQMLSGIKNKNESVENYFGKVSDFALEVSQAVVEAKSMKPAPDMSAPLGGSRGLLAQIGRPDLLKIWNSSLLSELPSDKLRQRHCDSQVSVEDRERASTDHGQRVRKAVAVTRKSAATQEVVQPTTPKAVQQKPIAQTRVEEEDFIEVRGLANSPGEVKNEILAANPDQSAKINGVSKSSVLRWIADSEKALAIAKRSGNPKLIKEAETRLKKQKADLAKYQ